MNTFKLTLFLWKMMKISFSTLFSSLNCIHKHNAFNADFSTNSILKIILISSQGDVKYKLQKSTNLMLTHNEKTLQENRLA